jgi:hypothetical protein
VGVILKGDWKLLMFHEERVLDGGIKNMDENNSIELYNLKDDVAKQNNVAQINTRRRDE